MKRVILGVAAALLLGAAPAVAEGLPGRERIKGTEPAASPSWNGFYIGGGIGAGAVVHDVSVSESYIPHMESISAYRGSNILSFDGIGGEGIFGTVIVGYDRLVRPGWVVGVFADYDFSGISSDLDIPYEFSASLDHNYSWSLGARLGVLSSPTTLWYGTAGYTRGEFEFGISEGPSRSFDFEGYFVGAGVESLLGRNLALRLEYRFTQFGSETVYEYPTVELEPSMHTARLVLTYRFGHRD
jgi:outer membrane immunogenic protein